jgi:hypothetical protein
MGKKSAPIVDQTTPRRKVRIKRDSAIDVWFAIGSFKGVLRENGWRKLSGMITYTRGKQSINSQ